MSAIEGDTFFSSMIIMNIIQTSLAARAHKMSGKKVIKRLRTKRNPNRKYSGPDNAATPFQESIPSKSKDCWCVQTFCKLIASLNRKFPVCSCHNYKCVIDRLVSKSVAIYRRSRHCSVLFLVFIRIVLYDLCYTASL